MTGTEEESVLSRWSRRKQQAQEADREPVASELDAGHEATLTESESESETAASPVLTDADMPAIESLSEDSDFSGFMSEGVSDELRNLALRKLFRAPVFNIRDGLDEYDEDYTEFEKLGDIVTSDMKHRIEMQEQKRRERLAEEAALEDQGEAQDDIEMIEDDEIEAQHEDETGQDIRLQEDISVDDLEQVRSPDE